MNGHEFHRLRFYQEQLFETKSKLFNAKSVKQLRFLQDRIGFLMERIDDIENEKSN